MWPFKRRPDVTPEEAAELATRAPIVVRKLRVTEDRYVSFEYPERHCWIIADLVMLAWEGAPPRSFFVRDKDGDRVAILLFDDGKAAYFRPYRHYYQH